MPDTVETIQNEQFKFDPLFQKKILKLMLDDPLILIKSSKYCRAEYFTSDPLRWIFTVMVNYYKKFNKIATDTVFVQELRLEQERKTEQSILFEYMAVFQEIWVLKVQEREYILDQLQQWLRDRTFALSWTRARDLFNSKATSEEAQEVAEAGLKEVRDINFNPSDRTFFFEDFNKRNALRDTFLDTSSNLIPTGIIELDIILGGGLTKGELAVIAADSGKGKSICVINIGAYAASPGQDYKVLHINLEGKDQQVENRYEARFLLENYNNVVKNKIDPSKLARYALYGNNLMISNFNKHWNYTIYDIEEELKYLQAHDFVPDLIIVDYADLLKPLKSDSNDKYSSQGEIFRQLKSLANRGYAVWTPTQCNRIPMSLGNPSKDLEFVYNRSTLADSYEKLRPCDLLITLNRTDKEEEANKLRIYVDKYRDKERGQPFTVNTNYAQMQIYLPTQSAQQKMDTFNNETRN